VRVLSVSYTTLAQARSKGIVTDHIDSLNLWYNPGGLLARSVIYIPFGQADLDLALTDRIRYIERAWRRPAGVSALVSAARRLCRAVVEALRLIKAERVDVLKANGPNLAAFLVLTLHYLTGKPAVVFIEAFWETLLDAQHYLPRWLRRCLPWWYRRVYRSFDFYFGTPSIDPQYYVDRGMRRDRILPWVNELDLSLLDAAAATATVPAPVDRLPRPRLVTVGRLHPEKLALDAFEVAAKLNQRGRRTSLILVGDGNDRGRIEEMAARAGLDDRLLITGTLAQEAGYAVVLNSDLYFAPMQGNALVEALYAGVPVVAYDHATHRNLIRDGETGCLVRFRDTDAVVGAIEALLDDPARARLMAANARRDMQTRFGRDIVADILTAPMFAAFAKAHS